MWQIRIGPRSLAFWAALLGLACLALPVVKSDAVYATVFRFFIPLFVTGFLPGLMVLVWARPASNFSLFDVIAVSSGLSLCLAQLLLFLAFGSGTSATAWGDAFPLSVIGVAGLIIFIPTGRPPLKITIRPLDIALLTVLAALVVALYVGGNFSVTSWINEDHIHLAIIRRLIEGAPFSPDNIHFVNGITYTYPFPGIHYFYALTSAVADLDPVFVYDKMGTYWSLVALTTVFSFSLTAYRSQRVAMATLALALGLVLLGPFAVVPGFYWGQLSPMPHVSDVAMNVVLPLQLLFVVRFILAPEGPATRFYALISILMTVMISDVHVREFIQYIVYIVLGTAFLIISRHPRWRRSFGMLGVSILIFAGFYMWHHENVLNVTSLIRQGHQAFIAHVASLTFSEFFSPLRPYASGIRETMFYGLGGLMLAVAPMTAVIYRRRPLVWMMMLSVIVYLAIVRIGGVAIPYVYFTFDEILSSTMRNVVFFSYVMLGGWGYWLVWRIDRLVANDPLWTRALTAVCAGLSIGLLAWLSERVATSNDFFADLGLALLLIVYGFGLVTMYILSADSPMSPIFRRIGRFVRGDGSGSPSPSGACRWGRRLVTLGLVVPVAVFTAKPHESPIHKALLEPTPAVAEDSIGRYYPRFVRPLFGAQADAVESQGICRREPAKEPSDRAFHVPPDSDGMVLWCVPSARLVRWLDENVGASAVMMINPANAYQAIPFFRGRLVVPAPPKTLRGWDTVLPRVRRAFADAQASHGGMAVFNAAEDAESKFSVLKRLGASHLLVDPMYYSGVMSVVRKRPDLFKIRFEEAQWAVVELANSASP